VAYDSTRALARSGSESFRAIPIAPQAAATGRPKAHVSFAIRRAAT
jgi:hypothetical protein